MKAKLWMFNYLLGFVAGIVASPMIFGYFVAPPDDPKDYPLVCSVDPLTRVVYVRAIGDLSYGWRVPLSKTYRVEMEPIEKKQERKKK